VILFVVLDIRQEIVMRAPMALHQHRQRLQHQPLELSTLFEMPIPGMCVPSVMVWVLRLLTGTVPYSEEHDFSFALMRWTVRLSSLYFRAASRTFVAALIAALISGGV
jgi:hypothetical protein